MTSTPAATAATDDRLAGRTAVITGAGQGIGRAIARRLGAASATVVLTGRHRTTLEATGRLLDELGAGWLVVPADVTDEAAVHELAAQTADRVGTPDIVVCNSGIGGPSAPLWEVQPADWEQTMAVNVTGAFLTLRAFLPGMVERGSGSVVLIGSMTGKRPLLHRSPYAASKLALVGLCRTAALDAAPSGVRVNLVSPGFVEGDRLDWVVDAQAGAVGDATEAVRERMRAEIPLRTFVRTEDVAESVLFLAGDSSAAITGADLNVSAGLVMY